MERVLASHHGPHPLGLHLSVTARHLRAHMDATAAQQAFAAMLHGIRRYHHHPFRRSDLPLAERARAGTARLLAPLRARGMNQPRRSLRTAAQTPTIVCVPSLINGPEILDLLPERSLLRWFADQGANAFLVDWGRLNDDDTLDGVITDMLVPLLRAARAQCDGPLVVLGHCMGGTCALAAACVDDCTVDGMILISSPWDFTPLQGGYAAPLLPAIGSAGGRIPPDMVQAAFALVDPGMTATKFQKFAHMDNDADAALFVAVEDWLNEGRALPTRLVQDIVMRWYTGNHPAQGMWQVAGHRIDPARIDAPVLVLAPDKDRVTPAPCATAIVQQLRHVKVMRPHCGHIGVIAGSQAVTDVWKPMMRWVNQNLRATQDR